MQGTAAVLYNNSEAATTNNITNPDSVIKYMNLHGSYKHSNIIEEYIDNVSITKRTSAIITTHNTWKLFPTTYNYPVNG